MPRRSPAAFVACAVVGGLVACGGGGDAAPTRSARSAGSRPNVVVIMTDDQTVESMRVLERTRALLADAGTTYANAISSFPLCCPARANLLTGQYAHNNGVRDNAPPDGGYQALDHDQTLAVWLQAAGYATAHVGKFLNGYTRAADPAVPPGWDHWFALMDPTATHYFDYDVNDDGEILHFGTEEADYQTDVLADEAVDRIRALSEGDQPFLLNFWPTAPHTGTGPGALPFSPAPAPRHLGEFDDEPRPRSPAIDEGDVSDKPAFVDGIEQAFSLGVVGYNLDNGTDFTLDELTRMAYDRYLESLLAVDEAVGRIVDTLDEVGELDDTVIMFLSDNGWSFGEHRIPFAKVLPYENVVSVPLIVRGAGFEAGATVEAQVAIIDLPATILGLAGASAGVALDGRALPTTPAEADRAPARALLLESPPRGSGRIPHYDGVRTPTFTFVRWATGETELYDRGADPDELENVADDPAYTDTRAALATTLDSLLSCVGTGCQVEAPPGT